LEDFHKKEKEEIKYNKEEILFLKDFILSNGFSLIIGIYDCDISFIKEHKEQKEHKELNSINVY
jgi:hypothetical protein